MEEEIIQPIDRELLKSELTPDKQLRMTNKSHNEIYIVTANDSPNVLKEIGRLREIAFREAGGGTGKSMDLDEFDFGDNCYKQLIVWNPEADEIIGGYRYLLGKDWLLDEMGQPKLATSHMFHFSDKFLKEYMPYTVELGRSFVSLEYQNVRTNTKSIFALDNLWDGLGALTVLYPEVKYFFGKMTMYPSYIRRGRDMILYFLKKHFDDKENLVLPMKPLKLAPMPITSCNIETLKSESIMCFSIASLISSSRRLSAASNSLTSTVFFSSSEDSERAGTGSEDDDSGSDKAEADNPVATVDGFSGIFTFR